MRCIIEPGQLKIMSTNADQEEAQEELEIAYDGDSVDIGFNVTYLLDVLANLGGGWSFANPVTTETASPAEVVRTARPNARLVFRNFVGWTEVPKWRRADVVEDRQLGEQLIARDRAVVQRRIAVCRVRPGGVQ